MNLARVKLRDQQRLAHGPLKEYSQFGEGVPFGKAVPRAGNDSGGGQPGWILKCKGWEDDPDAYIYFITQAPVWGEICDLIGKPEWKTDPDYATPNARLPRLKAIFGTIEEWTKTMTKFEVMEKCNAVDIPVGPILSMKEIAEEQSLRETGTVVEVDHPTRGKYLTVGNPIKLSDSPVRGAALAAARRAHRGNPRQGARLFGERSGRDQGLGRDHAGREGRARRGGVSTLLARPRERSEGPEWRFGPWRHCACPLFAGMSGTRSWERYRCVSWSTASRRSARRCSKRC